MIFDPSIPELGYAPEEPKEIVDEYFNEDKDMEKYYEEQEYGQGTI